MDMEDLTRRLCLAIWTILFYPTGTKQSMYERRLLSFIRDTYEPLERPVYGINDTLTVTFGIDYQQLMQIDEKNQVLQSNMWLRLNWSDVNLRWLPEEYGGLSSIQLPPDMVWRPDVLLYNSADQRFDAAYPCNVIVGYNGDCTQLPPGIFKSTCKIDITYFPFDEQRCDMKFGTWTHNGWEVDLEMATPHTELSNYMENGEWFLHDIVAKRTSQTYTCCPAPYIDITFTIVARRRLLYYAFNLLIPCFLISAMTLLVFLLPPESGEKLTLSITILLALTVFLLLVAETMPETSDAIPLIATYFAFIMVMCGMNVTLTVAVLNLHHRPPGGHHMSAKMRRIFLQTLPYFLGLRRNREKERLKQQAIYSKLRELELKERCSRTLLANMLDLDGELPAPAAGAATGNCVKKSGHLEDRSDNSSPIRSALSEVLKELRYITNQMKIKQEEEESLDDWKFAAVVMDRLCVWVFLLFTIISVITILVKAPHITL